MSASTSSESPKSGYALLKRYIKTKIFKTDALAQWTKDVGTSSRTDLMKGKYKPLKDT